MGTVFTVYGQLNPSVFSIGGILLALGLLFVAKLYTKIIKLAYFYKITMAVELIMLLLVCGFLLGGYGYATALFVYVGYQVTFMFGSYLVRAETVFLNRAKLLTFVDVAKQKGYLGGLLFAYLFYQTLAYYGIESNKDQVYNIHLFLLVLQVFVMFLVMKSFKRS